MEPSITSVELQRVCRAWEMNNGVHGWEEYNELLRLNRPNFYYVDGNRCYDEWVGEKSLHKSLLEFGWPLIEWLLKKSEV